MNAGRYKFSNMLDDINSETISTPFDHILKSIGYTINTIGDIEKICIENELEISAEIKKLMANEHLEIDRQEELDNIDDTCDNDIDSREKTIYKDSSENRIICLEQQPSKSDNKKDKFSDSSGSEISPEMTIDEQEEIEEKLINKLYKQLALKCHPDKTSDAKKNKMFIYMTECKKEIDIVKLLYIFSQLNTDTTEVEIGNRENYIIKKKLEGLDSYKKDLEGSVFYRWKTLTEEEKEKYIVYLKKYFKLD
jgi:hypothetical protein